MEELKLRLLKMQALNSELLKVKESNYTETQYHIHNYKVIATHKNGVLCNLHIYKLLEEKLIIEVYFKKYDNDVSSPIIETMSYNDFTTDQIEEVINDYQSVITIINMLSDMPI